MIIYKAACLVKPEEFIKIDGEWRRVVKTHTGLVELPDNVSFMEYIEAKHNMVQIWVKPWASGRSVRVDRMHGFSVLYDHPLIKPPKDPVLIKEHLTISLVNPSAIRQYI